MQLKEFMHPKIAAMNFKRMFNDKSYREKVEQEAERLHKRYPKMLLSTLKLILLNQIMIYPKSNNI